MLGLDIPDRELSVAVFVRERRQAGRLTQRQLGEIAGVGKRFVVELEAGKPTVRMDKVNQVLAVFGRQLGPVEARNR
ncbi:MAG: type II toxin-antitoxin system Y4mF family antitoxin [Bacteroidales bacterium]